jgi:hypothetical protein
MSKAVFPQTGKNYGLERKQLKGRNLKRDVKKILGTEKS